MATRLQVSGPYALFTRPECKVERLSYPVMTPSAARGILDSVFWHPGLRWVVDAIHVLKPIRYTSVRRNEVSATANASTARTVMNRGKGQLYISAPDSIVQRSSLFLQDVRYVIDAHFVMTDQAAPGDNPGKFQDIITRRIRRGQCYHQPVLGTRECSADFAPCEEIPPCPEELMGEQDLGIMLWDLDYTDPQDIKPLFFHAVLRDGTLNIPTRDSGEVYGSCSRP